MTDAVIESGLFCPNGHFKPEFLNCRGVCTKCAAKYAGRRRNHSHVPATVRENRTSNDNHD